MNISAIDEEAGSEVLKVLELEKSSRKMFLDIDPKHKKFKKQRDEKGIGHFIVLSKYLSEFLLDMKIPVLEIFAQ